MAKTLYHNDFYGPGLKERRKRMGKTQQEVAEEVGIPQSQVSKYENGMIPGADVAVDLYKATRDVYRDTYGNVVLLSSDIEPATLPQNVKIVMRH